MGVNADDLDAATRKRLGIDDLTGSGKKRRNTHKGERDAAPCAGACACGDTFDTYTAWERHADKVGPGHHVWRMALPT